MALEYKLKTLDGLSEEVKALYREAGNTFVLDVSGMSDGDDLAGLKSKVDQLISEKKEAEKKAREAQAQAAEEAEKLARTNGDIEALEKSWQEKLKAKEDELADVNNSVMNMTVNSEAEKLAGSIAVKGSASVLIPHIKSRLSSKMIDGKFVTTVLDANGQPSAATIEELKAEIMQNAAFQPIIAASNATGGGANGEKSGSGATVKTISRSQFDGLSPSEKSEFSIAGGKIND